ncbi:MAG: hypothetical protein NO474_05030 [Methanomassiliicoccales archaeon]|nr:hypothetical protein [Methanomassiliicoccales archaeon]
MKIERFAETIYKYGAVHGNIAQRRNAHGENGFLAIVFGRC